MSAIEDLLKLLDPTDLESALMQESFLSWWEEYGRIVDVNGAVICPKANALQKKLTEVWEWCDEHGLPFRAIILKPRQEGISTWSTGSVYHRLCKRRTRAVIIGGSHFQSRNLLNMVRGYSERDEYFKANSPSTIMVEEGKWENGSTIEPLSAANPQAARSATFQILLATELAYWAEQGAADARKVLSGALSCVHDMPGTAVIIESTANGACYDAATDVLTDKGWVRFKDLDGSEAILTKNPDTGGTYYQSEWKHQKHRHVGQMVNFRSRNMRLRVTPNHSMWVARSKGPMKFIRADELTGTRTDLFFERQMEWSGKGVESVVIPEYVHTQGNGTHVHPAVTIPADVWLRFLGHFLTEGNVRFGDGIKQVCITQTVAPDEFRASAQAMADVMGCNLLEYPHGGEGGIRLILANAQLAAYLKDFTKPKRIPRELLMGMSREQCRTLIGHLYIGDGCLGRRRDATANGSDYGRIFPGNEKEFSDDLQELYLKAGYGASETMRANGNLTAAFTHEKRTNLKCGNPPTIEDGCDEDVYCVTLPRDHLLMVRREGQSVWCGNSGDFYERYQAAQTFEQFKETRTGFVRIFMPWFLASSKRVHGFTEEMARRVVDTLSQEEKEYLLEIRAEWGYVLTPEEIEWRRRKLAESYNGDEALFEQDYPRSEDTAFLSSGRRKFNALGLRQIEMRAVVRAGGGGVGGGVKYGNFVDRHEAGMIRPGAAFVECGIKDALVHRYEDPYHGMKYLIAVDPAKGVSQTTGTNPDNHGVMAIRDGFFRDGKWHPPADVCRFQLKGRNGPECQLTIGILADEVARMARYYGNCIIVVEENLESGLIEMLLDRGCNLMKRPEFNKISQKTVTLFGWRTNEATRKRIIETLASRIFDNQETGAGLDINSPWTIAELKTMITLPNGRVEAEGSKHDDQPIALGMGLCCLDMATKYQDQREVHRRRPQYDLPGTVKNGRRNQFS